MARVTVEDCVDKVDSPYELVLVAKERAAQLGSGIEPTIDKDNDKNTVIALREIAEENVKVQDLTEAAVYKLRKHVEQVDDGAEDDEEIGDDFESLFKVKFLKVVLQFYHLSVQEKLQKKFKYLKKTYQNYLKQLNQL